MFAVAGIHIILGFEASIVNSPAVPLQELKRLPLAALAGAVIRSDVFVVLFNFVKVVPLLVVAVPVPDDVDEPEQAVPANTFQDKPAVLTLVLILTFPSVKIVFALNPDVCPVAVNTNVTPKCRSLIKNCA